MTEMLGKEKALQDYLATFERLAIAFSAGVDSAFLLKEAKDVLGDRVLAITAHIHSFPKRELEESILFCKKHQIRQMILEIDELDIPGFADNPSNRCYLCKKALFTKMKNTATDNGCVALAEGSNMDDESDYRPGHQAIRELGIISPLRQAKLYKAEIRSLSKNMQLPTWDKPSFACLATRFVTGEEITKEKLSMVEQAEQVLYESGLRQFRVRMHGADLARIEVLPEEIFKVSSPDFRNKIIFDFKNIGFRYVSLDLEGYRTGSMNVYEIEGSK